MSFITWKMKRLITQRSDDVSNVIYKEFTSTQWLIAMIISTSVMLACLYSCASAIGVGNIVVVFITGIIGVFSCITTMTLLCKWI